MILVVGASGRLEPSARYDVTPTPVAEILHALVSAGPPSDPA